MRAPMNRKWIPSSCVSFSLAMRHPILTASQHLELSCAYRLMILWELCFPLSGPEGAFKKLKSESSSLGGVGPGGNGGSNSCVGNSHIHNPTAAACPTPARRRHRTTFTQVSFLFLIIFFSIIKTVIVPFCVLYKAMEDVLPLAKFII